METLVAFARYWLRIWPLARSEIARWHAQILQAPESAVRRVALAKIIDDAHNVESIASFALLAGTDWPVMVRRVVRFELAYELLDGLSERASYEDSLRLHGLLVDIAGSMSGPLLERVQCIGEAQALNHADGDLRAWGEAFAPDLYWWEAAGAGICSLGVLAMLCTPPCLHKQIRMAYLPIDALAALLDALVDIPSDRASGNHNWLQHYPTEQVIGERIEMLIVQAIDGIEGLPRPGVHRLLLMGLLAHTLAAPGDHLPLVRLQLAKASRLVPIGALILRARRIPGNGCSGLCSIQN